MCLESFKMHGKSGIDYLVSSIERYSGVPFQPARHGLLTLMVTMTGEDCIMPQSYATTDRMWLCDFS